MDLVSKDIDLIIMFNGFSKDVGLYMPAIVLYYGIYGKKKLGEF